MWSATPSAYGLQRRSSPDTSCLYWVSRTKNNKASGWIASNNRTSCRSSEALVCIWEDVSYRFDPRIISGRLGVTSGCLCQISARQSHHQIRRKAICCTMYVGRHGLKTAPNLATQPLEISQNSTRAKKQNHLGFCS